MKVQWSVKRDLESLFSQRGFDVDHATINRWMLAYAPMIEKRLRRFRQPHRGSIRVDETYANILGEWRQAWEAVRLPADRQPRS